MKLALLSTFLALPLAAQTRTVTLAWDDNQAATYNVYRASGTCATGQVFAKVNTVTVVSRSYQDSVAVGTYCYYVTAVLTGLESPPSQTAEATVGPRPPTGLKIVVEVAISVSPEGVVTADAKVLK